MKFRPNSIHTRYDTFTVRFSNVQQKTKNRDFTILFCRFSHVFTADSGNSLGDLIGHSSAVNNISFRPERPFRLVSASEDNSLCFYEGPPFKFKISLKVCLCDLCTVNSYNVYLGDSDQPGSSCQINVNIRIHTT